MLYSQSNNLKRKNARLKRLLKEEREKHKRKATPSIHQNTSSSTLIGDHFLDMILRNREVPPQV